MASIEDVESSISDQDEIENDEDYSDGDQEKSEEEEDQLIISSDRSSDDGRASIDSFTSITNNIDESLTPINATSPTPGTSRGDRPSKLELTPKSKRPVLKRLPSSKLNSNGKLKDTKPGGLSSKANEIIRHMQSKRRISQHVHSTCPSKELATKTPLVKCLKITGIDRSSSIWVVTACDVKECAESKEYVLPANSRKCKGLECGQLITIDDAEKASVGIYGRKEILLLREFNDVAS